MNAKEIEYQLLRMYPQESVLLKKGANGKIEIKRYDREGKFEYGLFTEGLSFGFNHFHTDREGKTIVMTAVGTGFCLSLVPEEWELVE